MPPRPTLDNRHFFFIHRQPLVDALVLTAPFFRGLVLDVGCFDKPYERFLAQPGSRWIGCDLPRYANRQTKADVFGTAERLPFKSLSADVVFCSEVLHNLPEPASALAEMRRVLKPGGHLILSTSQQVIDSPEEPDFYRFTANGLRYLAAQANLTVVALHEVGGAIAMISFAVLCHLRWLHRPQAGARWLSSALQQVAVLADRRWRQPRNTIGWVLVAQRA